MAWTIFLNSFLLNLNVLVKIFLPHKISQTPSTTPFYIQIPGETRAVAEVLGSNNLQLKRNPNQPICAWAIYGE